MQICKDAHWEIWQNSDGVPAHGRDIFALSGLASEDHLLTELNSKLCLANKIDGQSST